VQVGELEALLVDELKEVAVQRVVLRRLLGDLAHKIHLAVVVLELVPFGRQRCVHRRLGDGHQDHLLL